MKLDRRAQQVSIAQSKLAMVVLEFQEEYNLTNLEILQALNLIQVTKIKYMLKNEE